MKVSLTIAATRNPYHDWERVSVKKGDTKTTVKHSKENEKMWTGTEKSKTAEQQKSEQQRLDLKLKHTRERGGGLGELTFKTLLTPRSQSDFH